ncbi:RHS repeat-associated core domain-containing protein [Candidatus Pantoea soli]|uniref:RHS repeat-associated core domain-containing protein n=1 Tax=Candidatus Pantoea soli TaxID=3098669 RepID=A0A518X9M1_9GAMM|nr:RHS repeat-associated core domain-containing protein [Pantoea soli]
MYYNRFRYCDPDAVRFISQDPVGLAGGLNLYQYAPNPLSWIEPLGLSKCKVIEAKNRPEAINLARQHSQVPGSSRGGKDIHIDELNATSQFKNW